MPAYPRYPGDEDADLGQTQAWTPDDPPTPGPRFTPDYSFAHEVDDSQQRQAARRAAEADSVFASGVWAEDEPDEPEAPATVVAPPRPPAARALPPADPRAPKRRTGLWIGLGAGLVVVVAAVLVVVLLVVPLSRAKADFSAAKPGLEQARATLQSAVAATQTTVGGIQASELADVTLLDQYTGLLDQAQASLATADPVMAANAKDIRAQVDQMTTLSATMTGQAANLTRLSNAIVISRDKAVYQKAVAGLSAAVTAAQAVYDSSEGNVDNEDLRDALKAQIEAANQLIAAQVADADLATVAAQMTAMAGALATADQAVIDNQRATGGKTYTYTLLASDGQISATQLPVDAVILAMKVYVTGSLVQVQTCYQQGGVTDLGSCDGYFDGQFFDMTGSRDGTTVLVQDVDPDSLYLWGTITFSGAGAQAKAIAFDGPPGLCQLPDGSVFGDPTLPSCGDIAG